MASNFRYRAGVVKTLSLPTAADGTVTKHIEVGDLTYVESAVVYPASYLSDAGTAAQNRAAFAAAFCGVALHKTGLQTSETSAKLTTDPGYQLIATSGDFEFPCAATSWAPGDLVGVYASASACSDQQVAQVTDMTEAIGIAKVPYNALGTSQTSIIVELRPRFVYAAVSSAQ